MPTAILFQVVKMASERPCSLKLMFLSTDFSFHATSNIFNWVMVGRIRQMFPKNHVICQENVLCSAGIIVYSIILQYYTVIPTQARAFNQYGCAHQHAIITNCGLTVVHNLKLYFSLEGDSTTDYDGTSSTVSCIKCLRWDTFIMPSESSRLSFSHRRIKISSTCLWVKFGAPQQILNKLWQEVQTLKTFTIFKAFFVEMSTYNS